MLQKIMVAEVAVLPLAAMINISEKKLLYLWIN